MRRKRTWLIAACVALALVLSVAGTIAYLTDATKKVENTFMIGRLLDDPLNFVLKEHKAIDADENGRYDGVYEFTNELVDSNVYNTIVPGVDLPKDPFVATEEELKLDAYVFIEVVEDQLGANLHYMVDTNNWTELSDVFGPKGGKVYVMAVNNGIAPSGAKLGPLAILAQNESGKEIAVDNAEITDAETQFGGKLMFYGYMIQAGGFEDCNAAWAGYVGSDAPDPVQATLTMDAGSTEYDWNKITITIKGTDIASAEYSFGKTDETGLESTTLTAEQIECVNSADGLSIVKEGLQGETTYKMVLVVSNSAGQSKTIDATAETGQIPPP